MHSLSALKQCRRNGPTDSAMLAIVGFIIFLAGSAVAYSTDSYPAYRRQGEIVAGILLMAGLALLGISLQISLNWPFGL